MKVELVSITKPIVEGLDSAEELIAYCARVSNPSNQMNTETAPNLLRYLIKNKHWSPFEMASMCVSIETSRAIAAQILRHRSFSFQEFSQRYSDVNTLDNILEPIEFRSKSKSNRQSSETIFNGGIEDVVNDYLQEGLELYDSLVNEAKVATETARFILPLTTKTKIYMNGTLRSYLHYLDLRLSKHTQKEHREIAFNILKIIRKYFPDIYKAYFKDRDRTNNDISNLEILCANCHMKEHKNNSV